MQLRTRVKICGITSPEIAQQAITAGADAIGFMFFPDSRRYIDPTTAGEILSQLPPYVETVGVFVDASVSEVEAALAQAPVSLLQFHGSESPEYCSAFGRRYVKVLKGGSAEAVLADIAAHEGADAVMLDSVSNGQFGGTGQVFDWQTIPEVDRPLILAGGLTPENVAEAIMQVRPFAVDVSGGVEVEQGIKDAALMRNFVLAVQKADWSNE